MATTLPRIIADNTWQSANGLSGIAPGSGITIHHAGGAAVDIVLASTRPTVYDQSIGDQIRTTETFGVAEGESEVWIKTESPLDGMTADLSVQLSDPGAAPLIEWIEIDFDNEVTGLGYWVKESSGHYAFNVPPGTAWSPLRFSNLALGYSFRVTFTVVGDVSGSSFVFRPGAVADDLVILSTGDYDKVFTAQSSNGLTRFTHKSVAGVARVEIMNCRLYSSVDNE